MIAEWRDAHPDTDERAIPSTAICSRVEAGSKSTMFFMPDEERKDPSGSVTLEPLTGLLDGFEGYYRVSRIERENVFRNGLIVLDTNALLDLYRLTPTARMEMISLLRTLAPRLFVPHQVAAEFHRRRIDAVASRRTEFHEQIQAIGRLADDVRALIRRVAQRAHGRDDDATSVWSCLEEAFAKGKDFINQVSSSYDLDPDRLVSDSSDQILDELTEILAGRVAERPSNDQIEKDRREAERRLNAKLPPGFKDRGKGDDAAGDYLWWAEVIRYAKGTTDAVLIVSNDIAKGDWTYDWRGMRIGADPRLVREMRELAGCRLILATTSEFLTQAPNAVGASVSPGTIAEAASILQEGEDQHRRPDTDPRFLLEQLPEGRSANYFHTVLDMARLAETPLDHGSFIDAFQRRFPTITRYDEACRRARVLEALGLAEGLIDARSGQVALTSTGRRLIEE